MRLWNTVTLEEPLVAATDVNIFPVLLAFVLNMAVESRNYLKLYRADFGVRRIAGNVYGVGEWV